MKYVYQRHNNEWWRMPMSDWIFKYGYDVYNDSGAERFVPEQDVGGKLAVLSLVQPATSVEGVGYRWGEGTTGAVVVELDEEGEY